MFTSRWDRQQRRLPRAQRSWRRRKFIRWLLIGLAILAIIPPLLFYSSSDVSLQLRKCSWLRNPPLVCAHGGDSSKAFPNTMDAYHIAVSSKVDCIEIDVSRSMDGVLFALHDRELQRISGNKTSRVGYLKMNEITKGCIVMEHLKYACYLNECRGMYQALLENRIEELHSVNHLPLEFRDVYVPTIEEALKFVSGSVRWVILDAKVGPPLFEKGLAKDILSVIKRTKCKNCLVWAKSDRLVRDVMKQSPDITVGYIVMMDPLSGTRMELLRMRNAEVVGVYHPLVDEKLTKILHRRKKKVYAWTVDEETAMRKMLIEQVDAIVTSNPSLLQRLMKDMRTQCLGEGFSLSS